MDTLTKSFQEFSEFQCDSTEKRQKPISKDKIIAHELYMNKLTCPVNKSNKLLHEIWAKKNIILVE